MLLTLRDLSLKRVPDLEYYYCTPKSQRLVHLKIRFWKRITNSPLKPSFFRWTFDSLSFGVVYITFFVFLEALMTSIFWRSTPPKTQRFFQQKRRVHLGSRDFQVPNESPSQTLEPRVVRWCLNFFSIYCWSIWIYLLYLIYDICLIFDTFVVFDVTYMIYKIYIYHV